MANIGAHNEKNMTFLHNHVLKSPQKRDCGYKFPPCLLADVTDISDFVGVWMAQNQPHLSCNTCPNLRYSAPGAKPHMRKPHGQPLTERAPEFSCPVSRRASRKLRHSQERIHIHRHHSLSCQPLSRVRCRNGCPRVQAALGSDVEDVSSLHAARILFCAHRTDPCIPGSSCPRTYMY
jgi:hypothetical protein